MFMRCCFFAFLMLCPEVPGIASDRFSLWGDLKPGPYDVGFTLRSQYDYTRAFRPEIKFDGTRYEGETARPVQILVWYPAAEKAGAKHLQFRDYVHLGARVLKFGKLSGEEEQKSEESYVRGNKALGWLMAAYTAAVAEAPGAKGKFPLIIFAPGSGGSAFSNSILCENLASHGYVVAAIPSIGIYSQQPSLDLAGFSAYARDIEFAIATMRTFPNADAKNVGIIGFSMGIGASTLVQMQNMNIHAAVCLDGVGIMAVPGWDRSALRAPQLYLLRKTPEGDAFAKPMKYAEVYSLLWNGDFFRHVDFVDDGMFAGVVPGLFPDKASDRKELYENVCRYALNFLNAYLKKDPAGIDFLRSAPEKNGIPEKLVESSYKQAAARELRTWDVLGIMEQLKAGDFPKFREAYMKSHAENPGMLLTLGQDVFMSGNRDLALKLGELGAEMHPRSALVRYGLFQIYRAKGDNGKSLFNAEKALELLSADPDLSDQMRSGMKAQLEATVKSMKK